MAVSTWMLLPFATSVFFAATLHCQSHSDENYHEGFPNGLLCTPICKDDDSLEGETFYCVLSSEGNDYKFIARNPEEGKWRVYRTDLDSDSSLLCAIGANGDKSAVKKSRRKCSGSGKSRETREYTGYDSVPSVLRQIFASQNSEPSDSSVPLSRKSSLAVSASGLGSFAQASDGKESLFASGDERPSAQTSGNAHAFSSDGQTNAESHFGKGFIYPATERPTDGRPGEESMPPFFHPFQQQQQPFYPVFGNGFPAKTPGTDYPPQSFGQNSLPFDDVFSRVGLQNPFLMLSGQLPTYSGKRNLRPGPYPRPYQPPSIDSLYAVNIPREYSVAIVPYMSPYKVPKRFQTCYPRCKREATDSASEENKSEEYVSNLDAELLDEICNQIEMEVCRRKRIMYCKEGEVCCWEDVNYKTCNDGQFNPSTECYKRLSTVLGL